jgi:cyclopropane-fatty-acyl-phospholipid synthase
LLASRSLAGQVELVQQDYRDLKGRYDRIVSIEMIEAVGHDYLPLFCRTLDRLLAPGGTAAVQAITMADRYYDDYRRSVDFIQYFVFPGANLISLAYLDACLERHTALRRVATEDITAHYATTLALWRERFGAQVEAIRALGFSEQFVRVWEYYFCYCEAGFRERRIGDVQFLLAREQDG